MMRPGGGLLGFVCAVALATGCMSTPRMNPPVELKSPLGSGSPVFGLTVVVEEFELATEPTRHAGPAEWLGLDAAQKIARGLKELGARAVVSASDATAQGDVYVRGRLTKVDGGSRSARMWAGFGAGGAIVQVSGTVSRADGERLGEFTDQRRSGAGSLDSTFLLEKCIHRIGRDVAEMITTGTYARSGGDPDPD